MTPYHLPNTAGGLTTPGPTNNYIANTHYLADKDGYLGRFDQQIHVEEQSVRPFCLEPLPRSGWPRKYPLRLA